MHEITEPSEEDIAFSISDLMIELNRLITVAHERGLQINFYPIANHKQINYLVARVTKTF